MALTINDKDIDKKLEQITLRIQQDFGIRNCSKSDAIRYLLGIRKQGKKTNKNWKKVVGKERY